MARSTIDNGSNKPDAPHAWAVVANGILNSVHVPIRPDGTIEGGDARVQAEVTFADLEATLKAAGASVGRRDDGPDLPHVAQAQARGGRRLQARLLRAIPGSGPHRRVRTSHAFQDDRGGGDRRDARVKAAAGGRNLPLP
jgi:hypothetical protein